MIEYVVLVQHFHAVRLHDSFKLPRINIYRGSEIIIRPPLQSFASCSVFKHAAVCYKAINGTDREAQFLFQRISVTIQRFNSVLLHDSFSIDCPDQ